MIYQLLGGFANILGNTLFIYIFHFGVAGAAMATFLSQTVAAVLTIRRLCHLQKEYRLCLREIRIEPHTLKQIFVIGVPVGFVNVVQSKELIMHADVPYIVAKGRKGGSNIAACIVNALLYMIDNRRD